MEALIILVVLAIIGILVYMYKQYDDKRNNIVKEFSSKIKQLEELNEKTVFHEVNESICISKHYDNKSNYNKIEPAYIMSSELKNKIDNYAQFISMIQENRSKSEIYKQSIDQILNSSGNVNYEDIVINKEEFCKRELKLFNGMIKNQYIDCKFIVNMSYSSPKGKVHLSKSETFNFDQMVISFNSISRSHLDRETYRNLSKAERGEVSDSMRYDVMNRDGFRCVICGASANEGARLHVDHIIPIAKGGKSEYKNLRTLCERCNIGKSDKIETGFDGGNENNHVCPWCNGKLILRKGKYGDFYGCENYPKCRYIKNND